MRIILENFLIMHGNDTNFECVIFKDGRIGYSVPSHVEAMVLSTRENRNVLQAKIPESEKLLNWLIEYTNSICVWRDGYKLPKNITKLQKETLDKLVIEGVVKGINLTNK